MLSTIKDILFNIGNFFTSVYEFFLKLCKDIVFIVKATGKAVSVIPDLFSWLPASILSIILVAFGVIVIYKIMGREG